MWAAEMNRTLIITPLISAAQIQYNTIQPRCLEVAVLGVPLTAGVVAFPAERGAREAAFTDDVAPGVRMPLTSRGALFPAKRVGDRASQAAGFTDDDDVALVGVRVPLTARALGAVSVFPAEGDGDVARREVSRLSRITKAAGTRT